MLIEFSVANFRSFRERQTFSMVAASRLGNKENTFLPSVDGEKLPPLLKVAAIYGPNASGKSNLVLALDTLFKITNYASHPDTLFPVSPFRFDPELLNKPSEFEIHFITGRTRYQFIVHLTASRIVYECLISYPKGKEVLLYERSFNGITDDYKLGELEGSPEIHSAWKYITSGRHLFIAQASIASSDENTQLKTPFGWLSKGILIFTEHTFETFSTGTRHFISTDEETSQEISSFLNDLDIPVSKVKVEYEENISDPFSSSEAFRDIANKSKTTLTHKSALGEAEFDYSEESTGTRNLFGFWLPWANLSANSSAEKRVLIVDELDSSLHPQIVENLVRQHLLNKTPAQLIFTTHSTHLMSSKLMRRDQFWVTERDKNAATKIYSVYDFSGREGEGIEKRYFEGRYRGLPFIRR
ncbi:ATP-binding protein [Pseudomonas sp. 57B-090624]|uniref:AAA family ATPase n=1 Tax=Pseudomonas sp. 57B-090624 TaxID=2213080 RepID=UPI000DAACD1C|nr:ATP-binding protein [Pseudomonas sp. 57B-090624]PZE09511.1 ATP-binding protein [Pseudomonas sp. 57B-090624]